MRHDVVVYGATGFTGKLVAEYLARTYGVGGTLSWAIAGRRQEALEQVRDQLAEQVPSAADLPLILADASDQESLRQMAAAARVVCTTVGPYARFGAGLVQACVEQRAHYCDLTGEAHFIKDMIDRHHAAAREAKVRIVHCCGFDSIPSDMGCFRLQEEAVARFGSPLPSVTLYVRKLNGGVSGGTIASSVGAFEAARDPSQRRALMDPYSLLPEGDRPGPRVRDVRGVGRDRKEGLWTAPFVMATVNAKVVRRSNALLGYPWGQDFAYEELSAFRGVGGLVKAVGITAALGGYAMAMQTGPTRRLLLRALPAPGEGPSKELQESGSFMMELVGRGEPGELRVRVTGDKEPGYAATAGMLGESAVCLAKDELPERFGVLTPASAMGGALLQRLPTAGVRFHV